MSTVYSHPDGGSIDLDGTDLTITAENGHTASVQIGPSGLRELAAKFTKNALDFERAMYLEGLSEKELREADSHYYATAEQVDNAAMQREVQRMFDADAMLGTTRIRTHRPPLATRGELAMHLVDTAFQPCGYTVLRAFSESNWRGSEPGEPDRIDLEIEPATACFDPLDAVVVYVRVGVGAKTTRDILNVISNELQRESDLLNLTPAESVSADSEDCPF